MLVSPEEDRFIAAFVPKPERAGWRARLSAAKSRAKFLDRLNHAVTFDERYVVPMGSIDELERRLRAALGTEPVHCISDIGRLDGREVPIGELFDTFVRDPWGTVAFDRAARAAAYLGESAERLLFMARDDTN